MSAADYRRLAEEAEARERGAVLEEVCRLVGIGVLEVQSRSRAPATVAKRAVVAWMLCKRNGWAARQAAAALRRTPRQVNRLLATR